MAGGYQYRYENRLRDSFGNFTSDIDYLFELRFGALVREISAYWAEIIENSLRQDFSIQTRAKLSMALKAFTRSMLESAKGREGLEEMHREVSSTLQRRVVEAYLGSGIGKGPSYRWNDKGKLRRYSNKQMLKALQSPALVDFDAKGIYFPNAEKMSGIAKQWYRLNFGAGPKGGKGRPKQTAMQFSSGRGGGRTGTTLSFDGFKPSSNFFVPQTEKGGRGYWSNLFMDRSNYDKLFYGPSILATEQVFDGVQGMKRREGKKFIGSSAGRRVNYGTKTAPNFQWSQNRGGALYIISPKWKTLGFEKRLSRGIAGSYFLDEGLRYLNKEYGQAVNKVFTEWFFKGGRRAKYYTQKYKDAAGITAKEATEKAKRESNKVIDDEMMKRRAGEVETKSSQMTLEDFRRAFGPDAPLPPWLQ